MKRLSLLLISIALLFGMTQCKKKVETITPATVDETVHISLRVDGSKHSVFPSTGAVVYTDGDVIYVGNNGKYVGSLTYADGAFSGDLTGVSTEDYLHFFFIGGLTPGTTPTAGTTTSFSIDISNQRNKLPVLSYGKSNIKYTSGTTAYSSILENQCALVKFTLDNSTSLPITLTGLRNTAIIDFANNAVTPNSSTGTITTYIDEDSGNGYRYAIVFATQAVVPNGSGCIVEGVAGGTIEYELPTPATANAFLKDGTISFKGFGEFTINSSGDKVLFSQGNLQYQASTGTWRFAEKQYDLIGNAPGNNVTMASGRATQEAWIDLFGWGTSGFNGKYPYMVSTTDTDYINATIANSNYDWGVYNAICNGGNQTGLWRTLERNEWIYVLSTRSTTSGIRYAKANVNGIDGLILLPDDWSTSYYTLSDANSSSAAFTVNIVSASAWESDLEGHGAVFLPRTPCRQGSTVNGINNYVCWTSTYMSWYYNSQQKYAAAGIVVTESIVGSYSDTGPSRYTGEPVRLVRARP